MAIRWAVEYTGPGWCMNAGFSTEDAAHAAAGKSAARAAASLPVAFTHWISGQDVVRYDVTRITVLRWDATRNDWLPASPSHHTAALATKEN